MRQTGSPQDKYIIVPLLRASDYGKVIFQLVGNQRGMLQLNTEQTFWYSLTDACLCSGLEAES